MKLIVLRNSVSVEFKKIKIFHPTALFFLEPLHSTIGTNEGSIYLLY